MFQGHARPKGRRWINLHAGTPMARTRPFWCRVLGTVKLDDREMNYQSELLHKYLKEHPEAWDDDESDDETKEGEGT